MKYKLLEVAVINLFIFYSCNTSVQEKKEVTIKEPIVTELQSNKRDPDEKKKANIKQLQIDSEQYWKKRFPSDSLNAIYIKGVLTKSKLSEKNVKFFTELMRVEKEELAFQRDTAGPL